MREQLLDFAVWSVRCAGSCMSVLDDMRLRSHRSCSAVEFRGMGSNRLGKGADIEVAQVRGAAQARASKKKSGRHVMNRLSCGVFTIPIHSDVTTGHRYRWYRCRDRYRCRSSESRSVGLHVRYVDPWDRHSSLSHNANDGFEHRNGPWSDQCDIHVNVCDRASKCAVCDLGNDRESPPSVFARCVRRLRRVVRHQRCDVKRHGGLHLKSTTES